MASKGTHPSGDCGVHLSQARPPQPLSGSSYGDVPLLHAPLRSYRLDPQESTVIYVEGFRREPTQLTKGIRSIPTPVWGVEVIS